MSEGRRLFVGETDVWVGVGHAWKDVPGTKTGEGVGVGQRPPTHVSKSIDLRSLATLPRSESFLRLPNLTTPNREKKCHAHAPFLYWPKLEESDFTVRTGRE